MNVQANVIINVREAHGKGTPSACLFVPRDAFPYRISAAPKGRQGRTAVRRIRIPHKSPALRTLYTLPRRGGGNRPCRAGARAIVFGFSRTEKRIQGGQRPPWNSRQRIKFVIVRGFVTGGSMPALSITLSIHAMLRPSFSMTSTPSVSCMTSPLSAPCTAFQ